MNHFKPWTSDKEPKAPKGWGLDAYRGRVPLTCDKCDQPLKLRDQYIYFYSPLKAVVLHNTKECCESLIN